MRSPPRITWLLAVSVIASGCNLPLAKSSEATPVVAPAEPTALSVTPFVAASPTSAPPPTAGPSSSTPPMTCPVPAGSPAAPLLQDPTAFVQDILGFLNGGGTPQALQADIQSAGLSPQHGLSLVAQDFNGDGLNDVAVSLHVPSDSPIMAAGDLYVFMCAGRAYSLGYTSPALPTFGVPEIIEARDLNGDGKADLLIGRETCGAHTCFSHLEVLIWERDALINVFQGTSDDLPYPSIRVVGPGANGRFSITVTGTGIGSVGAGPYRGVTRTWTWNTAGDALVPGPDLALPSTYRIHVLNDAEQADLDGSYATALALYDRVINDPSLKDWVDPQSERANLSAYAMFRQIVTHLEMGDRAGAQSSYLALGNAFPPASVGGAYGLLAQAFWTAYQSSGDIGLACAQAQAFAQANAATILQPLYFGYANPEHTPADICPGAGP